MRDIAGRAGAGRAEPAGGDLDPDALDRATGRRRDCASGFDATWGGFGPAPEFPRPTLVELCLRHARRAGSERSRQMALTTLDAMAAGGIYDHLVGGLLPLLDRQPLAGAPLREDADRSGAAGPGLPPRLAGDGQGRLPGRGDRDAGLRPRGPLDARGCALLLLRCRRRRHRRQSRHLHPRRASPGPPRSPRRTHGRVVRDHRRPATGKAAPSRAGRSAPPCGVRPTIEEARALLAELRRTRGPTGSRRKGPDRVERHGGRHAGRGGRGDRLGPLRPTGTRRSASS